MVGQRSILGGDFAGWQKYAAALAGTPLAFGLLSDSTVQAAVCNVSATTLTGVPGTPATANLMATGTCGTFGVIVSHGIFGGGNFGKAELTATSIKPVPGSTSFAVATGPLIGSAQRGGLGGGTTTASNWPADDQLFIGNAAGGKAFWIHLRVHRMGAGAQVTSLSVLGGQVATMGETLHAVPEPSSFALLGLLAAGAGGVMALKKYRREQPADAEV